MLFVRFIIGLPTLVWLINGSRLEHGLAGVHRYGGGASCPAYSSSPSSFLSCGLIAATLGLFLLVINTFAVAGI
jgi:hypothetical protein